MINPALTLADEILRLDSRGGRDTDQDPDYDPAAWPSDQAVRIALLLKAAHAEVPT